MNMKKQLWSVARMVLPVVGFALTCFGAFIVSLENQYDFPLKVIPAYIMIVFGLLSMLTGVFWTICHSMKSKIYQRSRHEQHIQVFTVERPSSFPPSYEESQISQDSHDVAPEFVVMVDAGDVGLSLAPPLYTQDSSDVPDCTWSWEQPPPYSQVERELERTVDAGEESEVTSAH